MSERSRWGIVVLFAAAMAWMESATVLYLRMLVDRVIPHQPVPLPPHPLLGNTELVREVSTLILLLAAGWLAGSSARSRFGYTVLAWGIWDILYYAFLYVIAGWPRSLFEWDVLFLIPLPWWGPVLAPMSIAALMIAGGTLLTQFNHPGRPLWPSGWAIALSVVGAVLALAIFMADAIRIVDQGEEALRAMLPQRFPWALFALALACMAVPVADMARQLARGRQSGIQRAMPA